MNEWINDEGVYRTAPATLGLLKIYYIALKTKFFTSNYTFMFHMTQILIFISSFEERKKLFGVEFDDKRGFYFSSTIL